MKDYINDRNMIIWLSSLNISSVGIRNIMKSYPNLKEVWDLSLESIFSIKGINDRMKNDIIAYRKLSYLESILDNLNRENIDVITILDKEYPDKLKHIFNRPKILYCKGNSLREDFSLAIVGSRKYSNYGQWACRKFSKEISTLDINIVSGLALGIDTIAHKVSLDNDNYTIAVLGCGLDLIYPRKNKDLYRAIEEKGTIVSEYPLGTEPLAYNFPHRNRIISGLSDGVIIIEAKDKSGSLITANHASEQGKNVFSIPGNINSIFSSGTNKLIRDGAIPLLSIKDIIYEYSNLEDKLSKNTNKSINLDNFSDSERLIIRLLGEGPVHTDELVYRSNIDISTMNTLLMGLELKGVIEETMNNVFALY